MCTRDHRFKAIVQQLPHQAGHQAQPRCAGCAYEIGFAAGLERSEHVTIDLAALPPSVANVHDQSPHMAWALGYLHGVMRSYASASASASTEADGVPEEPRGSVVRRSSAERIRPRP